MSTPEKCPKCGSKHQPCLAAVVVQFECGSMVDAGDGTWHDETIQCITRQRDQLAVRVKQFEDEVADYMKLFSDWKAYATNLESAGQQMLDGGFHAPHIINGWLEAKQTRP